MSIQVHAIPAPTSVEAGLRVVSAVIPTARVLPVDDQARQAQSPPPDPLQPATSADREAVEQAAAALNHYFALRHAELHFSVDQDSDRLVVKVIDARDGTLIRQIPDEHALRMAQVLHSEMPALFKQKA